MVLLVTQMRFMLLATLGGPVIAFANSMRRRLRQRRGRAVTRRVMPKAFALLDCQWTRWELLTSDSDIVTFATETDGEPVVIKIALSIRLRGVLHITLTFSLPSQPGTTLAPGAS